ncbi:MAG: NAD(P)/FAD-dependent oxidoreductase [Bacillota bacterium]|nr:NAD(P)/FAD-dependent oxidoreductase [Bacillota bacterium]
MNPSNQSSPDNKQKPVALIIGAGPAGLTAAWSLLEETGYRPVILEASHEIGGISRTVVHHGNRMDIGGHRFFTKSQRVNEVWQRVMPTQGAPSLDDLALGVQRDLAPGGPDPEREDRVMLIRDRVSRIYFLRRFFDYPISLSFATLRNLGFGRTLRSGLGYLAARLRKLPETNLENFYINRFGRPLYEMFFEGYTEKVWGVHPREISADWGAQRVKGLSLWRTIAQALTRPFRSADAEVETSLIESFHYPKYGPGQLYECMAADIEARGGRLHLGHEVTALHLDPESHAVTSLETRGPDGQTHSWTGDVVFSTMPIKDLCAAIRPADLVPQDVAATAAALPYRDFMTVGLLMRRLLITNETQRPTLSGSVPDNWIYVQDRDVRLGRLQIFNNWSPYLVENPRDTLWIGLEYFCNEGDPDWEASDADFTRRAIKELAQIGIIDPKDVLDSVRIRVKKAYPAYFGAYRDFDAVSTWLQQLPNLICIGRNGQHRYNNMDHSMLTALTAVDYLNGRATMADIWAVNTESSYHESDDNRGEAHA